MIVFVVGIYKSGTSLITSKIEEMGIPSVVEDFRKQTSVTGVKHQYNILESYEVNMLNNDIIYSTGQNEMYFETIKMPENINESLRQRIRNFYNRIQNIGVIKDPRFIGTLQYWIKEIPEGVDYKIIWVDRDNIDEVEASFKKDKWFVGKVKEEIGYRQTIKNLNTNLHVQYYDFNREGIKINYEFYLKYPEQVYKLIYNYLSSNKRYYPIYKIYFAEYYKPSKELTQLFARQCPHNIPVWDNLMAVDSQDEADYIIIQDKTNEEIKDESKVIFLGREPKHVPGAFRDGKPTYFKSFHHEYGTMWLAQTWWLDIPFSTLETLDPPKTKSLSVIDSGKNTMPGHGFRLSIIDAIQKLEPSYMDIFGKINGKILPERDKQQGLLDYKYYLAIENGVTDHYFSEKIVDALLCLCMPIYFGCNKLEEYLPEGSFIRINPEGKTTEEIAEQIIAVSKSDLRDKNIDKIKKARNLILNKYNIWPTLNKIINEN